MTKTASSKILEFFKFDKERVILFSVLVTISILLMIFSLTISASIGVEENYTPGFGDKYVGFTYLIFTPFQLILVGDLITYLILQIIYSYVISCVLHEVFIKNKKNKLKLVKRISTILIALGFILPITIFYIF